MPHAGYDANRQSVAPNSYNCRITDLELIVGLATDCFPVFTGGPTPFAYEISRYSDIGKVLLLTFMNEMAVLAEAVGADIERVRLGIAVISMSPC